MSVIGAPYLGLADWAKVSNGSRVALLNAFAPRPVYPQIAACLLQHHTSAALGDKGTFGVEYELRSRIARAERVTTLSAGLASSGTVGQYGASMELYPNSSRGSST